MTPTIAIFDIGKTNKKAFLFDESYRIVWEKTDYLSETTDEDGDPCEDVAILSQWIVDTFAALQSLPNFEVKAVNFSAYGASFVHIDKHGKPLTPLYNYLKPYPEALQKQLYEKYEGEKTFARITASPVLGSLNSGMQLYRLKIEKPDIFTQIQYSLHLPQYASFLLSNQAASDITSIGCHTHLWDFDKNQFHPWTTHEGIAQKFAPIQISKTALAKSEIPNPKSIGFGLHDSSAALIPYLLNFKEPFVLLSTGTWSISLNPFNDKPLTDDELESDCLCYLTYEGKPVKASRLFAGYEHEQQCKQLAEKWNVVSDYFKQVTYNPNLFEQAEVSYDCDYHCFMKELVAKQIQSTNLIIHNSPVKRIFIDGGFSKNSIFINLLATAYPDMEVYAAEVAQASALGAALILHDAWNTQSLPHHLVSLKKYTY